MVCKYVITMLPYEEARDVRRRTRDAGFITKALADETYVGEQRLHVSECKTLAL